MNLPPCRLKVRELDGGGVHGGPVGALKPASNGSGPGDLLVFDAARACWLVLTPEEWVRRHVLAWLTGHMGIPPALISQEYAIHLNGTTQRADLVVFGSDGRPRLLVECKASGVAVSGEVLSQAYRYNSILGARYLMLTNGLDHYFYEILPDGNCVPLNELPDISG